MWALRIVAVAVVVVGVAAIAVPYAYIHFVQGKAPARLALPTATTGAATGSGGTDAAGGPSTVGLEGTWNVAGGSQAGYRVKEILFGQDTEAVGRTSDVTGNLVVVANQVTSATFTINLTTVKSDQRQRDNQFQGRIMSTASHPTATFVLSQPIDLGTIPAQGATAQYSATGRLTLRSTTRDVTFPLTGRRAGATLQVSGSIPITFADWQIPNPSFGPATTQDHGQIEFLVNFAHA
jgi:polyisoprenoid-binding protein YceI